ncbi:MAG: methyltransferase [Flavobacteriales bacterium]|nr:methyltransferase [Flavobacteriales bacterium]|tara:strand:+ start:72642 stop:73526 length:885 start_codon:yes stop_codon:yes gene_type:complete
MILLDSCPICKKKNLKKKLNCIDHSASNEEFTIVSCGTCDFVFTNPRPKDENLTHYYNSNNYISHANLSSGLFNWTYQRIRAFAIKLKISLLKSVSKKGHHLDIGCGTGEFLNACRNVGFNTQGIEPSDIARSQAINNYNLSVSKSTNLKQFNESQFDSISMWHVLEHIPNLNQMLADINRVLSKKGKLIIAVPNLKSWDARHYKEYWAAWDVPIHLWHFSKETLVKLLNKHGFKKVKQKAMIFDAFYVSALSEEYKNGSKNLIKSFAIGIISNLSGIFTKNGHSSTIYVFEKK